MPGHATFNVNSIPLFFSFEAKGHASGDARKLSSCGNCVINIYLVGCLNPTFIKISLYTLLGTVSNLLIFGIKRSMK